MRRACVSQHSRRHARKSSMYPVVTHYNANLGAQCSRHVQKLCAVWPQLNRSAGLNVPHSRNPHAGPAFDAQVFHHPARQLHGVGRRAELIHASVLLGSGNGSRSAAADWARRCRRHRCRCRPSVHLEVQRKGQLQPRDFFQCGGRQDDFVSAFKVATRIGAAAAATSSQYRRHSKHPRKRALARAESWVEAARHGAVKSNRKCGAPS